MLGSRSRESVLAACVACSLSGAVAQGWAAGSTSGIDAGLIALADPKAVRLDWVDLYISPDEIRASYQFTNVGPGDVKTTAVLPLAPIEFHASLDYAAAEGEGKNMMGLEVTVDGAPVTPELRASAQIDGDDVTPLLGKYDIPVVPFALEPERGWDPYFERLEALSPDARAELEEAGALSFDDPTWTALAGFVWPVNLRREQPVEISLRYTPIPYTDLLSRESLADKATVKRYCIDPGFASTVAARLPQTGSDSPGTVVGYHVRYIMVTSDARRDPIGRFYLTVDRASSDTLMSLCASGAAKTGETAIRLERFDYIPDKNIDVLFVRDLSTQ